MTSIWGITRGAEQGHRARPPRAAGHRALRPEPQRDVADRHHRAEPGQRPGASDQRAVDRLAGRRRAGPGAADRGRAGAGDRGPAAPAHRCRGARGGRAGGLGGRGGPGSGQGRRPARDGPRAGRRAGAGPRRPAQHPAASVRGRPARARARAGDRSRARDRLARACRPTFTTCWCGPAHRPPSTPWARTRPPPAACWRRGPTCPARRSSMPSRGCGPPAPASISAGRRWPTGWRCWAVPRWRGRGGRCWPCTAGAPRRGASCAATWRSPATIPTPRSSACAAGATAGTAVRYHQPGAGADPEVPPRSPGSRRR